MPIRLLHFLVLAMLAMAASAHGIDHASAQAVARAFALAKPDAGLAGMRLVHNEPSATQPGAWAWHLLSSDSAFVVVSGDDDATATVLAYGDCCVDMEHLPPAMRHLLDAYREQMDGAHPAQVRRAMPDGIVVPPMITTQWFQGKPFNRYCPLIDSARCMTGCCATAVSQVLNYWQYPAGQTATVEGYEFVYNDSTYSLDELPPTVFDWENMRSSYNNGYTETQANAVGWLMRYVGQAIRTTYGPNYSSSGPTLMCNGVKALGYDQQARIVKSDPNAPFTSDDQWVETLLGEMEAGRPVVYAAKSKTEQHAFIIDGYDGEGLFHVNFGWGGLGNGYYALDALSYGGMDFKYYHQMIVGVQPPLGAFGPELRSSTGRLSFSCLDSETDTATFVLAGEGVTGDVQLTLSGDHADAFTITPASITGEDIADSVTVTVVYHPTAFGSHRATVVCSADGVDDVFVNLYATASLERHAPVLLPVDSSSITATGCLVAWSDSTPADNIASYTLQAVPHAYYELAVDQSFAHVTKCNTDCSSQLDSIVGTPGWTGHKLHTDEGYLRLGSVAEPGWLQTPALDMSRCDGMMTVIVTAQGASSRMTDLLTISNGDTTAGIIPTLGMLQYALLLPCTGGDSVHVRIANHTANRYINVRDIQIYAGDNLSPGDTLATVRQSNITGTTCALTGLAPGRNYQLTLQAHYVDGTASAWSNRMLITLLPLDADVNGDGEVSIADVNAVADMILSGQYAPAGDVTGDGEVSIADVNMVADHISGQCLLLRPPR